MLDVSLKARAGAFSLDVSFRSEGGVTALFGRSGSGKSMTLGLIAGLAQPVRGHVRLGGAALVDTARGVCLPSHRRRVGLVFQDAMLFPHLSVRRNLLFGRWFAGRDAGAAPVTLAAVVDTLGLGNLLERSPRSLSGGERQRVAIGRALLAAPRLLLFDEPLAALDRQRRLDILPLIERVRDEFGIPMVYVTHAAEEVVRLASRVVMLSDGRVSAAGPPDAVLTGAMPGGAAGTDRRFGRVSVLGARVGARDERFGLTALDHPAGRLWLAGPAPAGATVRVAVHADAVSLAAGPPGPVTIRSSLRGRIAAVEDDGPLAAVTLALEGGGTLVALVTRRALHDLALAVGASVTALIKTVSLDEGSLPGAAPRPPSESAAGRGGATPYPRA